MSPYLPDVLAACSAAEVRAAANATAMDIAQFTSKERKQARKSLLKKIDTYNKQVKKTRQPAASFPITNPSKVSPQKIRS